MTMNHRGQAMVEFVLVVPMLLFLLAGFVGLSHVLRRHMVLQQALRLAMQLRLAGINNPVRIEFLVRSITGQSNVQIALSRFDKTAAARFYHLDEIDVDVPPSVSATALFHLPPMVHHDTIVIQPPEEN